MPFKSRSLLCVVLLLSLASACVDGLDGDEYGRLDLVIRPDSFTASGRPLRGSFVLQCLKSGTEERITIDARHFQTWSATRRTGAYLMHWREDSLLTPSGGVEHLRGTSDAALGSEARVIIIAPAQITTVNVWSTRSSDRASPIAAVALGSADAQ